VQKLPYEAEPSHSKAASLRSLPPEPTTHHGSRPNHQHLRATRHNRGLGAMGKGPAVLNLAKKISAPVATTLRGKSLLDGSEPLTLAVTVASEPLPQLSWY